MELCDICGSGYDPEIDEHDLVVWRELTKRWEHLTCSFGAALRRLTQYAFMELP